MIYKEKFRNLLVPQAFIVPSNDLSWPQSLWGWRLGQVVHRIRKRYKHQESKQALSEELIDGLGKLGFVEDVTQYKWDAEVLPSLRQFKKLYDHSDVPHFFVVPEGDAAWPISAWGRRLGATVVDMRAGKAYASQMAQSKKDLEKINFCFTTIPERDWTEKIIPSLKIHQQEFGHCIVRQNFKIPSCHPWPKRAWGISLGQIVSDVRLKHAYVKQAARSKDILDKMGFAWSRSEAVWYQNILPSVRVYHQIFKNGNIFRDFIVPSEFPWPEQAWGIRLGVICSEMRSRGTYFRYFGRNADVLDTLGFNLRLSRRAWLNRVVPLIDVYALQSGGKSEVPDDFVIPSADSWPREAWGIRLGLIVQRNTHN
ncbi:hypothetical protein CCR75_008312 [Bremia lactucae]|uniref:Helicase-associated domain-containing protein n=1 Tax=Bremia lactucae TaxID=4779 RepID=A0A976FIM0_BRELC|nr:hypothetical protein CCR75_008315 [Bremia lactucae]TDH67316.1 hypothetical protein CCR75_008312 [Bremia lactucae]